MAILPGNPGDLVTWQVVESAMKLGEFGSADQVAESIYGLASGIYGFP